MFTHHQIDFIFVADSSNAAARDQTLEQKNDPILRLQNNSFNELKVLSKSERIDSLLLVRDNLALKDSDNNAKLRQIHREKKRNINEMYSEGRRLGLDGVALLAPSHEDTIAAKLVKYTTKGSEIKKNTHLKRVKILSESIFSSGGTHTNNGGGVNVPVASKSSHMGKEAAAALKTSKLLVKHAQSGIDVRNFKITNGDNDMKSSCLKGAGAQIKSTKK